MSTFPESLTQPPPQFLVGLDVRQQVDSALEEALSLALRVPHTRVDVVWVPPQLATPLDGSIRAVDVEEARDVLRERVRRVLERFGVQRLVEAGTIIHLQIVEGRPAQAISQAASVAGANLIIVGAQDRGRRESVFVGSVSRRLVQEAPCPVLVVRPNLLEQAQEGERSSQPDTPRAVAPYSPSPVATRRIGFAAQRTENPGSPAREILPLKAV